jgi:hypothetical protein
MHSNAWRCRDLHTSIHTANFEIFKFYEKKFSFAFQNSIRNKLS